MMNELKTISFNLFNVQFQALSPVLQVVFSNFHSIACVPLYF